MKAPAKIWDGVEYTRTDTIPNAAYVAETEADRLAGWAYQFIRAERWKSGPNNPDAWEKLRPENRQFWLDEATRFLSARPTAPDTRVVSVELLQVWQQLADLSGQCHMAERMRAIIGGNDA